MARAWAINAGKALTPVGTATIAAATDLLTITAHGLSDGDRIAVDTLTGGAVGVLVEDEVLYVRDAIANTFAVTRTLHGPAVVFSSDGGAEVHRWTPAHNASELRRIQAMHLFPGSSHRFGAREGVRPTGQSIVEVSGQTWIQRDIEAVVYPGLTSVSGPYVVEKAEDSGTFDPADGTNPRIDALDLQVLDDDQDASGDRNVFVRYVAGTPAGTPLEPPLFDATNCFRIGTFDVPAGGTPGPSVRSEGQLTVATGGVLPARVSTELPTTGRYEGMAAYRTDDDTLVIWDGAAWQIIATPQVPQAVQFTSSGSFVKGDFPWGRYIVAEVQGGGGGGGGATSTGAGVGSAGGGGGGGGYARKVLAFSALAASETVTVGAAGTGAAAGNNAGGTGGTSSLGAHCSGTGGGGGGGGGTGVNSTITDGGEGGTGSGGDINVAGGDGFGGHVPNATNGAVMGGFGGGSFLGGTEKPSGVDGGAAGTAGKSFGGGGSGGYNSESQGSNRGGGAGAPGIVLVTVY